MGGNHHIFQNAASVLHKRTCLSVGENKNDYGRAVVRVGILAHDFRIQARYFFSVCGVFDGYDNGRLSASSRGRIRSRLQYGVEQFFRYCLLTERAHASSRFDGFNNTVFHKNYLRCIKKRRTAKSCVAKR